MRDLGLSEAVRVAGGVGALARLLGIAQPSVSNWTRVPAERVLAVEAATRIDRAILRPDLYPGAGAARAGVVDDIENARADEYALLATLLMRAPDADLLRRLATLHGDPSALGAAHAALAAAAAGATAGAVEREFFALFVGVGRGELLPYGSYYLTGFLHERPLARLREHLTTLGIERAPDQSEPEDNIAVLLEIMAGLASGALGAPAGSDRVVFERHLAPWAERFFGDLERAESADFYRPVGTLGRVFIDIETEAFALPS
jgi:TorA maturation chaperone TorD